jgi:hypothetical protein
MAMAAKKSKPTGKAGPSTTKPAAVTRPAAGAGKDGGGKAAGKKKSK